MAGWRYMTDGVLHRTFSRRTDEMAGVVQQPLAIGEIFGVGEVSPGRVFEGLHQAVRPHGNEPITGAAVDCTHNVADDAARRDATKVRCVSSLAARSVVAERVRKRWAPDHGRRDR